MKTQCPSFLPSSHLYSTSVGRRRPTLLIYPPFYCLLAFCLGQLTGLFLVSHHGSCSWFLGRFPQWSQLKLVYILFQPDSLSRLFTWRGLHLLYVPWFYSFSVYQPIYRYPFLSPNQCIAPNPRPIVSILILFTKLFSCFLCVSVISLLGRG